MEKNNYIISWDNTADIPAELIKGECDKIDMSYVLDGKLYDGKTTPFLDIDKFYSLLKNGKSVSTSLIPESDAETFFEKHLKEGKDILHISFSSGMSGTYENYLKTQKTLSKKYPNQKIIIIDSLAATGGQGLICHFAIENREKGMNIEENEKTILGLRDNVIHLFSVDDMMHLYRGGRITKAKAIIATLAHIKPLLCVNSEGRLQTFDKAPGWKLTVKALSEKIISLSKDFENKVIFITHTNAEEIANELKEKVNGITQNVYVMKCSPIIGAHLGYGAVTLFALGKTKDIIK